MELAKRSMQLDEDNKAPLFHIHKENNRSIAPAVFDPELMIRRAFETDADTGIAMLFQQYYSMLCSHAVRYVSSKAIAEDIVSDIFFEFHSRHLYNTITTSFRAFLFTSVRHRAFDYVRNEMKRNTSLENATHLSVSATQEPDAIIQYEELYHDLEKAINEMPLKRRQIYVMHRFEGKKYQEIATELNLSLRTIEAHLYQALKQIRKTLQDKWLILIFLFLGN
ncbi:MAG: RNA polymerase sigma-70 factor [Spirosomataceae bacterium]